MKNRILLSAILLLVAGSAAAQQNWKERMIESSDALKAGDYAKALAIDDRVLREMFETLGSGEAETVSFSVALTHKALALAGLGRNEDAVWYWHEALSLAPSLERSDVTEFGAAGLFLKEHPLPPVTLTKFSPADAPPQPGVVSLPKAIKRVEPQYPYGARYFHESGAVIVQVNIDDQGFIRDARILKALPAPSLSHAVTEALRRWRFTPGMLDGKAVPVVFHVTVVFKVTK